MGLSQTCAGEAACGTHCSWYSRTKRLRLQAQGAMKFDPKKSFWVPDPAEGFIGGQITGESGANVTIALDAGGEVRFFHEYSLTDKRVKFRI